MKKVKHLTLKLIPIIIGVALLATVLATSVLLLWPSDETKTNYIQSEE